MKDQKNTVLGILTEVLYSIILMGIGLVICLIFGH